MSKTRSWLQFRRTAIGIVGISALLATAACGRATDDPVTEGLPSEVKIVSINPTTGLIAFAGLAAHKGYELAIKEINESDLLGDTKILLEKRDTRSEGQTAASEMASVAADKSVSLVFGSVSSNEAVAQSPLAEKHRLPTMYTQAGSDGVVLGDYTWRATPKYSTYYSVISKFLVDAGYKTMGVIYTSATPTLQALGETTVPQVADDLGIEITKSIATAATTQDFSPAISQVLASKPDVVTALLAGAMNPTVMTQLRQAGYAGPVIGNLGAGAGNLKPAGQAGEGMVWPVNFHFQQSAPTSQKFVERFRAEYGEDPLAYSAEAYDAAWFVARSIAAANSADRVAIKDAMIKESTKTFDGALGTGLSWKGQDLQAPGVVVEYTASGEKLLYEGTKAE